MQKKVVTRRAAVVGKTAEKVFELSPGSDLSRHLNQALAALPLLLLRKIPLKRADQFVSENDSQMWRGPSARVKPAV